MFYLAREFNKDVSDWNFSSLNNVNSLFDFKWASKWHTRALRQFTY